MYPGGEPTSRDTECFSMYSDMSTWIIASSSPNRNSASVRASSVFPTPDGPRKMNEPVGRFGSLMPAHARRGLVDEVDRLVRKMAVLDVAVRERRGCVQRVVGDLAAVVRLVAVAQAAQDLHGVVDRRLVDADLLEAPLERRVALEVLAVLVERRRADRLQLPARERRLQDRSGVDRALGGARPDEVMQLVDEQDDVAALLDLLHDLLQALLELAAVLRARHQRREVERVDLLVLQQVGHLAVRDQLGEALDH